MHAHICKYLEISYDSTITKYNMMTDKIIRINIDKIMMSDFTNSGETTTSLRPECTCVSFHVAVRESGLYDLENTTMV